MTTKTSDWQPGPTVCRCCLTEGCYKDISTEYFWMGKREVYAELLNDTLNISIAYAKAGPNSNSRLICEPCISRLRDAHDFRRQVLECEKTFMQYLDPGSSGLQSATLTLEEVKVEQVKQEKKLSDDEDFDDRVDFVVNDDTDDDLDDEPLMKLATKVPKKEKEVDLLDLLDSTQITVKRKSTASSSKAKEPAAKKAKKREIVIKPSASKTASKAVAKVGEKKKKGKRKRGHASIETNETDLSLDTHEMYPKMQKGKMYQRSARAEARIATKKNAAAILACWTFCPFRWTKNRFKCAYCEADFTDCTSLRDHVRICSTQHTISDVYNKFREMPLINVDATDAICCVCSAPFADISQMHDHVIEHGYEFDIHHRDGVLPFFLDKESWKCFICTEKFNNFLKLYEHMNVHYQYYICDVCGKGYMTAPRLRKHSEVHISGSFACTECDKIFVMRAARDAHKASAHSKGPRYECPHCNTRFHSYYDRMAHLKDSHSEREVVYNCSYCDLSFKTSGSRATHVRNVHFLPQRDFKCSSCHWKFKTSYELKRHMVRHTLKAKTFRCSLCGKSFPRVKALTTHLKTHQDLDCKWCGLNFKQKSQLMLHSQATHGDLIGVTSMEIKENCCQ